MKRNNTSSFARKYKRGHYRIVKDKYVVEDNGRAVRLLYRKSTRGKWLFVGKI